MTWKLWTTADGGNVWQSRLQSIQEKSFSPNLWSRTAYGLTAYRLAKELCVPVPRVNDVVRGKRAISADTALRLGIYFGLPAQFWLNLQNDYDLRLAAKAGALQKIKPRTKAA